METSQITKQELINKLKYAFTHNEANELHATNDGNVFVSKSDATNHARAIVQIKKPHKDVATFTKANFRAEVEKYLQQSQ